MRVFSGAMYSRLRKFSGHQLRYEVEEMQDRQPKLINPSLLTEYEIKNNYKNI